MAPHILVIDNDTATRQLLEFRLFEEGWDVTGYNYTHANLEMVESLRPALIILDINANQAEMGWKFLQLLKMKDATAAIPILISTSATTLSLEIEGYLVAQGIHVLRKPFDLDLAVALIRRIFMAISLPGEPPSDAPLLPILIVEDDEDLLEVMVEILRLEGYRVATAAQGRLALEAVTQTRYALIVLDMMMSVMDGPTFLAAYARHPAPHSPVIIYTAGVLQGTPPPSFVVGMLPKPFEIVDLLTMVSQYAQHV